MSRLVLGWRCIECGGKVKVTDAREDDSRKTRPGWVFLFCNYPACLNNPNKGGGEQMSVINYSRGFTPNWVKKVR